MVLADSMPEFVEALGDVDFRVAFTTTDNDNPRCEDTEPEFGRLVLSSCRSRLHEFTFPPRIMADPPRVCEDRCREAVDAALSSHTASYPTRPTPTDEDPRQVERPWIERVDGITNLPDGVSIADALGCVVPQGFRGCGFEQPLEAMNLALTRSSTPDDDAYGFAQGGVTAVVFVTTEADCSYGPEAEAIFSPEGSKVFWSLPDEQTLPTSAVCWNAGVQCTGLMDGVYDTCGSVNLDPVSGEPIAAASAALRPLGRYLDQIGGDVKLYGIVGVPPGYPQTPLEYRTAPSGTPNDRDYEVNFGIGPGCVSSTAEAVPPVRLREVIEASASTFPLQSVCQDSYGEALRGIALDIIADF